MNKWRKTSNLLLAMSEKRGSGQGSPDEPQNWEKKGNQRYEDVHLEQHNTMTSLSVSLQMTSRYEG